MGAVLWSGHRLGAKDVPGLPAMTALQKLELRVICADLPAPPLFWKNDEGVRLGFETDVTAASAKKLGRAPVFAYENWVDFYPALEDERGDLVLCGQGISE